MIPSTGDRSHHSNSGREFVRKGLISLCAQEIPHSVDSPRDLLIS